MVWLIHWLLAQVVFRGIAWVMGAAFVFVSPWLSRLDALLAPLFTWFDPLWARGVALSSDYRVWIAGIAAVFAIDGVILVARKRAARRA